MILADKKSGITEKWRKDKGLTWHHNEDGKTMELIPQDLHMAARHTGGMSVYKNINK